MFYLVMALETSADKDQMSEYGPGAALTHEDSSENSDDLNAVKTSAEHRKIHLTGLQLQIRISQQFGPGTSVTHDTTYHIIWASQLFLASDHIF